MSDVSKKVRFAASKAPPGHLREGEKGLFEVTSAIQVFKKVRMQFWDARRRQYYDSGAVVAKLWLPVGTLVRLPWAGRKCRASQAIFLAEDNSFRLFETTRARFVSLYDRRFMYKPDDMIFPQRIFDTVDQQCASGIHFYFAYADAIDHPQ